MTAENIKKLVAAQSDPQMASTLLAMIEALSDLTDGEFAHDLVPQTGLSLDRCQMIEEVGHACVSFLHGSTV
jgi:hypothetical protein